ncbi:transcriptional activator CadC [Klebsiella pneumoniae]|nr:transcriptional activator CadC [Klebsiella pneumoniae]
MFAGKKSAQIREILISESAWEEMTCLFAPSLNYVLLGKVYEMKGENRLAADSYITAFNLRPGEDTLYWIENGVFQTSVNRVVPYLDNFLSSE